MIRYRAIAETWDYDIDDMIHMPATVEVHEGCKAPRPTGLVDQNGVPLYRVEPTVRLGFQT